MRIGIFSDVHSNLEALETVVEFYKEQNIDKYICLGDVVGYGANPNACCDIVRGMVSHTVLGNHDAAVSDRMDYGYYYDAARKALNWHRDQINEENYAWLRSLSYRVDDDGLTYCHGSPKNLEDFDYIFTPVQAEELLSDWDSLGQVTFIGHSHLTKAFSLHRDNGAREVTPPVIHLEADHKYVVTVGSVGQPRDNDNRACCTIFDDAEQTITYFRLPYNIRQAARKIFQSELSSDFGKRLYFGV
ncbi:MAG: metallophosphoesterase [Myxococcales bacterium]|nr:metallophosphoesterase [Myxococcales bacterium]